MRRVNIGLLGCGTVGRGFVELLGARARAHPRARRRRPRRSRRILVRDAGKQRPGINPALLSTSAIDVLDDGCDIIVELVGGVHCAGAFVRRASANGKHVVTANKALLADHGRELFAAAERNARAHRIRGQRLRRRFRSCGALRHGLAGDRIEIDQRNPERHVQLHPDAHGAGRSRIRRRAAAGAGARIRRGRSVARRRRRTMPRRSCESWRAGVRTRQTRAHARARNRRRHAGARSSRRGRGGASCGTWPARGGSRAEWRCAWSGASCRSFIRWRPSRDENNAVVLR